MTEAATRRSLSCQDGRAEDSRWIAQRVRRWAEKAIARGTVRVTQDGGFNPLGGVDPFRPGGGDREKEVQGEATVKRRSKE